MQEETPMYDVEMSGSLGYCCHVFVIAARKDQAEKIAAQNFPELELTGNTVLYVHPILER
jgi:hypothetical protein